MTVRSGKWDPPAAGWFERTTSPGLIPLFICSTTAVSIEPKCTGRWGAFANKWPFQSKIPQEKSNLYLIFVLIDVFCRTFPIYSAIPINLVEYMVNFIGSQSLYENYSTLIYSLTIIFFYFYSLLRWIF